MSTGQERKRNMGIDVDLEQLVEAALKSGEKEAYRLVSEGADYRIGLTLAIAEDGERIWFIEFLLRVFDGGSSLEFSELERVLRISRDIEQLGYRIAHQDDGWIGCEKRLRSDEIVSECAAAMRVIMRHFSEASCSSDGVDEQEEEE